MKKNPVWLGAVLVLCLSASQALACGQDGGQGNGQEGAAAKPGAAGGKQEERKADGTPAKPAAVKLDGDAKPDPKADSKKPAAKESGEVKVEDQGQNCG